MQNWLQKKPYNQTNQQNNKKNQSKYKTKKKLLKNDPNVNLKKKVIRDKALKKNNFF